MVYFRITYLAMILVLVNGPFTVMANDITHIVDKQQTVRMPFSRSGLWDRIKKAGVEYADYAPIPRIALFDLTYPKDEKEYLQMAGYGLLAVSAICQVESEIPLRRVYLRNLNDESDLVLIRSYEVVLSGEDLIVEATFGKFMYNALYLFPMHRRADPGELVIDFAENREGFVIAKLPFDPAPELPITPMAGKPPPDSAVQALIDREIHIFASPGKIDE